MTLPSPAPALDADPPAPRVRRQVRWLGSFAGLWAIVTGFAAFALLDSRFDPKPHAVAASR